MKRSSEQMFKIENKFMEVLQYEVCRDRPDGIFPSDHESVAVRIMFK